MCSTISAFKHRLPSKSKPYSNIFKTNYAIINMVKFVLFGNANFSYK